MKTTRRMPSFESVAAGNTATLRLPIGLTYHQLLITYSGVTLEQMDEIRVIANGQPIQRYTKGTQIDDMNKFEGRAGSAGILVIDFERYGLLTQLQREGTVIGTGMLDDPQRITTLTLEIDINSAAAAPKLAVKARQSEPSNLNLIKLVRNFSYNAPAVGEYEIADIPKGDLINKIRFESSAISAVRVERNNFVIFERTKAENDLIQSDGERKPTSSAFVIDPTELGEGKEGIATRTVDGTNVNDLRFILTMTDSGNVPVVLESIGTLIK